MHRLAPKTALLLTVPPLLWAGNAVVGKLIIVAVAPLTLNFLRWSLAAAVLLPLGWRVFRRASPMWSRWRRFAVLGLLGVGCYNSLQYLALKTSTPINVTLIAGSMPVWMLATGALTYKVPATRRQIAGAALSLAGVVIVMSRGSLNALTELKVEAGDLYMIVAVVLWAIYSWMLTRQADTSLREFPWAEFLLAQIAFGVLWSGAAAAIESTLTDTAIVWTPSLIAALSYLALGPSLIAYRCWGIGVAAAGPAMASFFGNLTPLVAALLSAALLGDAPRWYHAIAFGSIVAGIFVSSRR